MIATRRERNQNFIAWPIPDEEYDNERFTPCRPLESDRIISSADWPPEPMTAPAPCPNTADEEIRLGRVKKFLSMEELIVELDEPE